MNEIAPNKINEIKYEKTVSIGDIIIDGEFLKYFPLIKEKIPNEFKFKIIPQLEKNVNFSLKNSDSSVASIKNNLMFLFGTTRTTREDMKMLNQIHPFNCGKIISFEDLLRISYNMLISTITSAQDNFLLNINGESLSENLLSNAKPLIKDINLIVETALRKKMILIDDPLIIQTFQSEEKSKVKVKNLKVRIPLENTNSTSCICVICGKKLSSFCGLGGHMSRAHPRKSKTYKEKSKIREKRFEFREAIRDAQKVIAAKHGLHFVSEKPNKEEKLLPIL